MPLLLQPVQLNHELPHPVHGFRVEGFDELAVHGWEEGGQNGFDEVGELVGREDSSDAAVEAFKGAERGGDLSAAFGESKLVACFEDFEGRWAAVAQC